MSCSRQLAQSPEVSGNETFPVIVAYEMETRSVQMDELVSDTISLGTLFSIDVTREPLVTGKTLAMQWRKIDTAEAPAAQDLVNTIDAFVDTRALDEENSDTLRSLLLICFDRRGPAAGSTSRFLSLFGRGGAVSNTMVSGTDRPRDKSCCTTSMTIGANLLQIRNGPSGFKSSMAAT